MASLGKRRVVGDRGVEAQATEPAIAEVEVDLVAEPA
jgi:hypothetical protein